jgi:hypothetical protein
VQAAGYGADSFRAVTRDLRDGKLGQFWDEHSFDEQRFFNIACLIYGSNPQRFGQIVERGFLPKPRASAARRSFRRSSAAGPSSSSPTW